MTATEAPASSHDDQAETINGMSRRCMDIADLDAPASSMRSHTSRERRARTVPDEAESRGQHRALRGTRLTRQRVDRLLAYLQMTGINAIPKLTVRVRFPSPAPRFQQLNALINDQSDLPSWMLGLIVLAGRGHAACVRDGTANVSPTGPGGD